MTKDISDILRNWPSENDELAARKIIGLDGSELLQLRIDLGVLQMFFEGRPDGEKPFGQPSLLDHLSRVTKTQPDGPVDPETWSDLDREIMQFYQRRRALLILAAHSHAEGDGRQAVDYYERAARDADHSLRIMDFIRSHSADQEYIESHERYRPFVLMHRTLAEAQTELIRKDADEAVERLKAGVRTIEGMYRQAGAPDMAHQDPSILQLRALERQVRKQHRIIQTLHEELEVAIQNEEFERAAELRDRLRIRQNTKPPPDEPNGEPPDPLAP